MAKKPPFPVKEFRLPGGAVTEQVRWAAVREALGQASGTSKAKADAAKVKRAATASGSGKVSFFVFHFDPAGEPKSGAASKRVRKANQKAIGVKSPKGGRAGRSLTPHPKPSKKTAGKRASQKPQKFV